MALLDSDMANPETARDKSDPALEELKLEKITDCSQGEDIDKNKGKDVDQKASHELRHEKIPDNGCCNSQSDQEEGRAKLEVSDGKLEVVPLSKEDGRGSDAQELALRAESTPVHAEKVPEDGFNWRKYGQKNVKANEFIRSYYRCTYPFCQVKRQVERSHDGQITDTVYLGQHIHPPTNNPGTVNPPASPANKKLEKPPSAKVKEKLTEVKMLAYPLASVAPRSDTVPILQSFDTNRAVPRNDKVHVQDNDSSIDSPLTKKKKRGIDSANATAGDTPSSEARTIVHTVSEVDIVDDGHRWRKYGQKMVKGNTNPRSYYRCSWVGCPARKLVERASDDPKVVTTTYEGHHLHGTALEKTVAVRNADGLNVSPEHSQDSKKQPRNAESIHHNIAVESAPVPAPATCTRKIHEEISKKAKKRAVGGKPVGLKMPIHPGPDNKPDQDEQPSSNEASRGPFTDMKDENPHTQLHANNAAAVHS